MHAQLSYWERETFFNAIDVAIIGSGIVGLNAAITLKEKQPNWNIVILERGVLPIGASTRNAGFACFGSLTELIDDVENGKEEEVFHLVERRWQGLKKLRERIGDQALGYKEWGGYEIFKADEIDIFQNCNAKISYFNEKVRKITGFADTYQDVSLTKNQFGFKGVHHLILNRAEGQIHTGKMMNALLSIAHHKGIKIYNGIEIKQMEEEKDKVVIHTSNNWKISSQQVLVATNGFARQLFPDLQIEPARNQVLITQPIPNLKIKGCFHYDRGYFYFRNIDNRILLGGGRHLAKQEEATNSFGTTPFIQNELKQLLENVISPHQKVAIDQWWSGILGVGAKKTPIIKKISERIIVAIRLGGMGVALGSLVGEKGAQVLLS